MSTTQFVVVPGTKESGFGLASGTRHGCPYVLAWSLEGEGVLVARKMVWLLSRRRGDSGGCGQRVRATRIMASYLY